MMSCLKRFLMMLVRDVIAVFTRSVNCYHVRCWTKKSSVSASVENAEQNGKKFTLSPRLALSNNDNEKVPMDTLARLNEMERFFETYFANWSTKKKHQDQA